MFASARRGVLTSNYHVHAASLYVTSQICSSVLDCCASQAELIVGIVTLGQAEPSGGKVVAKGGLGPGDADGDAPVGRGKVPMGETHPLAVGSSVSLELNKQLNLLVHM